MCKSTLSTSLFVSFRGHFSTIYAPHSFFMLIYSWPFFLLAVLFFLSTCRGWFYREAATKSREERKGGCTLQSLALLVFGGCLCLPLFSFDFVCPFDICSHATSFVFSCFNPCLLVFMYKPSYLGKEDMLVQCPCSFFVFLIYPSQTRPVSREP